MVLEDSFWGTENPNQMWDSRNENRRRNNHKPARVRLGTPPGHVVATLQPVLRYLVVARREEPVQGVLALAVPVPAGAERDVHGNVQRRHAEELGQGDPALVQAAQPRVARLEESLERTLAARVLETLVQGLRASAGRLKWRGAPVATAQFAHEPILNDNTDMQRVTYEKIAHSWYSGCKITRTRLRPIKKNNYKQEFRIKKIDCFLFCEKLIIWIWNLRCQQMKEISIVPSQETKK